MSVTFTCDAPIECEYVDAACLCAQFAPGWPAVARALAEHASPTCGICRGTGITKEAHSALDRFEVNVANLNAYYLLAALRLRADELLGELPLHAFQQALLRAANTSLSPMTRPAERLVSGGQVPRIVVVPGLPEEKLRDYVTRLQDLVLFGRANGATLISWS